MRGERERGKNREDFCHELRNKKNKNRGKRIGKEYLPWSEEHIVNDPMCSNLPYPTTKPIRQFIIICSRDVGFLSVSLGT